MAQLNDLLVLGNSSLIGDVQLSSNLNVSGAFNAAGTAAIGGALTVSNAINATGNITGNYLTGAWLQTTASTEKTSATKLAMLDDTGWVYWIKPSNITSGAATKITVAASTSNGTKYLLFSEATSGNVNTKLHEDVYYYYGGTYSSLNVGKKTNNGILTLWKNGFNTDIKSTATAAREILLPDKAGTLAMQATWNDFIHSGNEFTFASDGYSGSIWFNYRTASGSTNGNITGYIFGNGKGGQTGVTVEAATFKGAFTGDVSGNATSATKVKNKLTINGKEYDGSAAINVGTIAVGYGGTGNTSFTANRLVWTETATKMTAGHHYANSSKIGVNLTSEPSYNFYVNGTSYLNGATIINSTATINNLLTISSGDKKGIKLNAAYITSANTTSGEVVLQGGHLRFGGAAWDYNVWAGLKYDSSTKIIYLGLATGNPFTTNTAQSGGTLALPGVQYFTINGKEVINAADSWLRINEDSTFSSGIYTGSSLIRSDNQLQVGSGGAQFYAKNDGTGYFDNDLKVKGHVFAYNYGRDGNNAPAFILDKNGGNFTGIGSHNETDTIWFGAVASDTFTWIDDYYQTWRFNGYLRSSKSIISDTESSSMRMLYGATRNSGIKYDYGGRESLIISAGTYAQAGISFYTANELNMNDSANQWSATTPSMHILKKSVAINYNLTADPTYNLYVNGTGYFTDVLHAAKGLTNGGRYVSFPGGGEYTHSGGNLTGYLRILLPTTGYKTATMLKFKVSIFNYVTSTSVDYIISGYTYSDANWHQVSAICLGKKGQALTNLPVRFGYDSTRNYVYIGESTTVWSYPNITISDITTGHSGNATQWQNGWGIDVTTSLASINHTLTNTFVAYNAHHADTSTTSEYPAGFASRVVGAAWGNTVGTSITSWNDASGGSVDWRMNNPSSGKISMKVDGRVYVNEGLNPVLSSEHVNGYWGICTPDGANSDWIRTTTLGIIPYQSGGHGSIGTSSWPFNEGYFKHLNVTNDASNSGVDALAYFRHYNNNDWTVRIDSGSYDYGLSILNAHTATNALSVTGASRFSNTLRIGNGSNVLDGNYCEGIRIRTADSQWSTIIMGATADTGTNANAWSIHRKADNNFCISRNSSNGVNGLVMTSTGMGLGTESPAYRLDVKGDIYADGGWFRVSGANGLYWQSYGVHLCRNNVSSYGCLRIYGGAINGYEGIHFGSSTSGMTIMNIDGSHQGLYQQSGTGWIIYNNGAGLVGIADSYTVAGYKTTLNGNTYNNGHLTMNGRLNLRVNGGSWYNPIITPTDSGIWYDASGATSSTYWSMMALKFPNTTFSIGGERQGNTFGIYSYNNSRTANGYDGALYVNGSNHYFYCTTRLYGAVWNDYAEFRTQKEEVKPGYCVASSNDGQVYKTTEKFQTCDGIVSDTYGFSIGETDDCKTPLAVAGRVLAYCGEDRESYNAGDTVCAGPGGLIYKMTREEIKEYPDRIVGTVSEIPNYEIWGTGKVKVDGRIWIKVK